MACVVNGCKSHSSRKYKELSFHRFPDDEKIRDIWIMALHRKNWKPSKFSRICSKHFKPQCYIKGKKKKTLCRDAIPTIFENYPSCLQKESLKLARNHLLEVRSKLRAIRRDVQLASHSRDSQPVQPSTSRNRCEQTAISSKSLREFRFDDTPLVRKLKKALLKESKNSARRRTNLRAAQQKCRRLECKVLSLENTIQELKSNKCVDDESASTYIIVVNGENEDLKYDDE